MWPGPLSAAPADTAWLTLRWAPAAGHMESAQLLQARAELAERAKAQALLQAAARAAILKHHEAQVGQFGWQRLHMLTLKCPANAVSAQPHLQTHLQMDHLSRLLSKPPKGALYIGRA